MKSHYPSSSLSAKTLCCKCIGEEYLANKVHKEGKLRICSYCKSKTKTFLLEEVADLVEATFDKHYTRTSDQPHDWQNALLADRESDFEWGRDGLPVIDAIEGAAEIPRDAAEDIQSILDDRHSDFDSAAMGEETEFSGESHYEEKSISDREWQYEWIAFENTIKKEARFFSRSAADFLSKIFDDIDKQKARSGRPMVIKAGPDSDIVSVYRARVFQSAESLEQALAQPDTHLGPPPSLLAKAGRMNAHGISVFYGASESGIALGEVRPPVGSRVAVAKFDIIRPLRLLDLSAAEEIITTGSIFDPEYADLLAKAAFLRTLKNHMTKPVMPDDEATEYLTTQAVADFLATEVNVPLDGIIYPSVQVNNNGFNLVLFHKASTVERIVVPEDAEIETSLGYHDEDGWVDSYTVFVRTPSKPTTGNSQNIKETDTEFIPSLSSGLDVVNLEPSENTLKICHQETEVHIIRNIEVVSDKDKVSWYQHKGTDPEF